MILRRSDFVHVVGLTDNRFLVVHALTHLRLGVDSEVGRLIAWFAEPRDLTKELPYLLALLSYDTTTLANCVASLLERGVLTERTPDEERAEAASQLMETHGRDPGEMLERFRRRRKEGAESYWTVAAARGVADLGTQARALRVVLLGDCDLQTEADFLRQEGVKWSLDLRVVATFPDDVRLVGERPCDVILLGALRSRHAVAFGRAEDREEDPTKLYIEEARRQLVALRASSGAPIFIDNLPEPTVQPLGLADRGASGHRNRYRRVNLALEELAQSFTDVYVVDVAAALGSAGAENLLDDGLTSFTHFGSPGWMLQRPQSEKDAVHGIFPDAAPLLDIVGDDPHRRERVVARAHIDAMVSVIGVDAKKCVIVDLDGVLWPGVLAETGSPFAWTPEISSGNSFIGLYFGLHEALKCLKRRGLLLAAVSKNDEAVVRELWRYPDFYPRDRLLTPDDFVTWRVNWIDKAENIRSIADELGFALESFIFIDDRPIERERVRQGLPQVEVWGEEPFSLRRRLLTDPRLQTAGATSEAESRTDLVRAQLDRARLRTQAADAEAFLASLEIVCRIEKLREGSALERVQELLRRTTQFNTTGRQYSVADLKSLNDSGTGAIFAAWVSDRFGDHGLVAAAIVAGDEIVAFVMSCRVIGLGVEHRLLGAVLDQVGAAGRAVSGKIIETSRNVAVRNLYRDHGFSLREDDVWVSPAEAARRGAERLCA
jgi:FkbH-like protein